MHSPFALTASIACAPRAGGMAVTATITTTGTGTTGGAGCVSELD